MNKTGLFRLWSRQLQREFEYICWSYGLKLAMPLLEISRDKSRYGSWNHQQRTISISSVLIENYTWDIVIQILKHEMAHQVCSEIFGDPSGGHGENFRQACDLLGLAPEFRSAGGDLPQHFAGKTTADRLTVQGRRFIEKIGKLLALARSPNEHEANLAMTKAGELMDRYNLRSLEDDAGQGCGYVIINHKKKRIERYQRQICHILQEFFYVRVVFSSLYDPRLGGEHRIIELLGRWENIEVAEYVYYFLEKKLQSLWQENRRKFSGNARRAKNSYYSGLLDGFFNKLQKQNERLKQGMGRAACTATTSALVVAEDRELGNFVANRYPRLSRRTHRAARIYRDSYDGGLSEGGKIVLNKGVGGKAGNSGRLLGYD